jgi:hypothetical protein
MEISEENQNCKIVQIYVLAKKKILNICIIVHLFIISTSYIAILSFVHKTCTFCSAFSVRKHKIVISSKDRKWSTKAILLERKWRLEPT